MKLTYAHLLIAVVALGAIFMTTKQKAKGLRNNNPLNIERGENWQGAVGDDGRFVIFETAKHGLRAAGRILRTYSNEYGIKSINTIIARWAPPSENDTENYIQFVSQKTGIEPSKQLAPNDYAPVVAAMIHMENGSQPYDMQLIKEGVEWGLYG
ncbi:virion protein [Pseudoalteromonas aurantia]|uniref:Virion protein n=1 Tax=Pseudoalteromonas aurantia 208 TaxID=1314867 RepID=A0ABR9EE05_9GAMM|nr:virion protein [Pseudoalteromonas aurantia]MBE0369222.1 hypothetical protein [Pseudoalteromonas aurantia 208]